MQGFPGWSRATGVTAVIGKGEPCILLRADIDALPLREENNLDFRSESGYSHMCGHDSHAAMLLGAAQILKEMEDELEGTVKLMFQPGEETGAGARILVENGALENPKADVSLRPARAVRGSHRPGRIFGRSQLVFPGYVYL